MFERLDKPKWSEALSGRLVWALWCHGELGFYCPILCSRLQTLLEFEVYETLEINKIEVH